MHRGLVLCWIGLSSRTPTSDAMQMRPALAPGQRHLRPTMSQVAELAGAGQKVRGQLAVAKEKYGIPDGYAEMMDGFLECSAPGCICTHGTASAPGPSRHALPPVQALHFHHASRLYVRGHEGWT